jgi:hypothetical protein
MKKFSIVFSIFVLYAICFSETHVFWYKVTTNNYPVTDCNPGPCFDGTETFHEGMIATGTVAQHSGSSEASLVFGSGADDQQGRCGFIWSYDLNKATGAVTSAKVRAEYRDGWSSASLLNPGPIKIRCGVSDFQGNIDTWGSPEGVPETADWQDFLNPLSSSMGYDFMTPTLQAEEIISYTAVAGRTGEFESSVRDGQFFEVDITEQVNWILENEGQYAVVLLVPPNEGNTGKVNSYSMEDCPGAETIPCPSDNPWTADGNTANLVLESSDLKIAVEEKEILYVLNTASLSLNGPNPFKRATTIQYNTGGFGKGKLQIYDIRGKRVFSKSVNGSDALTWNAFNLTPGIYVCCLKAGKERISRQMILAE